MKRIQLFEFEDQPWFGELFRSALTNLLNLFHKITGLSDVIANRLAIAMKKDSIYSIIDLGSGSGGPMPEVLEKLRQEYQFKQATLTLTDLNPSSAIIEKYNQTHNGISYLQEPVDAAHLTNLPGGYKTMLNSFHHMPPEKAKQILRSAMENNETLFIYELSENKIPVLVWALFLPLGLSILFLMTLFMTPFVKPLSFSQLFFTYIIPVIPILYAWDGQASMPRIYTPTDLEYLTSDLQKENYTWRFEKAMKPNGKQLGYFFIGSPSQDSH